MELEAPQGRRRVKGEKGFDKFVWGSAPAGLGRFSAKINKKVLLRGRGPTKKKVDEGGGPKKQGCTAQKHF